MSFLDNVIGLVSPKKQYERLAWQKAQEELRNYDAGETDRLNASWRTTSTGTAEQTDGFYRDTLRNRSRDLERNSDMAESIILNFEKNIIGTGFKLQATTKNEELNKKIEELWKEWKKPKNCDVTAQQSFDEICRMVVRRKKIDGGIIIVKRYTDDGMLPFALQIREVDDLDTMMNSSQDGKRIVNGIEYNSYNRPIAYHLKTYDTSGLYLQKSERIESKDIIFLWTKRRPSQIREVSEMASTLNRIRDVNSYMEAVAIKERVAACLSAFIKRALPTGGYGRDSAKTVKNSSYSGKTLSPGMIMELNPGDDVAVVTPPGQGSSAADFIGLQQRLAGAGQGLSYEAVSRDMSQTNYSSARQGLLDDQKTYEIEQLFLVDHMLTDIYESFLISAVLSGKLIIRDFWNNQKEYLKHSWTSAGMKWIDPLKEANANKVALESGQTTLAEIAASRGSDWKDVIDQRALENEYAASKGVSINAETIFEEAEKDDEDEGTDKE